MDHAPEHHTHSHGHAHTHGHTHAHDHGHDHHHGSSSDYYLQQLLTIFICGAFGVAGILMYTLAAGQGVTDDTGKPLTKLGVLLVPGFHPWVLGGSLLLLAVTVIRGIALWRSAGAEHTHDHHHHDHSHDHHHHDHKPGEACDRPSHAHDHHHDHDHGDHSAEDHAHGNIYWRVVVLLLPIVILVMGLPNGTFSADYLLVRGGEGHKVGDLKEIADTGEFAGDFETVAAAAYSQPSREAFTGMTIRVTGKMKKLNDTQFSLFYFKMTCCAADQVPLKATCVVKNATDLAAFQDGQDVTVRGQLQFAQDTSSGEWVTVIKVAEGGLTRKGK